MKKFLVVFLSIMMILSLSFAIACKPDGDSSSSDSSSSIGDSSSSGNGSSTPDETTVTSIEYVSGFEEVEVGWAPYLDELVIKVNYSDGTNKTVNYEDEASAFTVTYDDSKLGLTMAEIAYGNKTCDAEVRVICIPSSITAPDCVTSTVKDVFKDKERTYYVGDDNPFYFFQELTTEKEDGNDVSFYKPGDVAMISKMYIKNGDGFEELLETANYVEITLDNSAYDFTESAIGQTFKIEAYPEVLDYVGTADDVADNTITIEIEVMDGYNVYTAEELLLFDNIDTKTAAFRVEKGITVDPNSIHGLVLHNDLSLNASVLPKHHFYYEDQDAEYFAGLTDEQKARINGSLKDLSDDQILDRNLGKDGKFVFEGNYFLINAENVPYVMLDDSLKFSIAPTSIVSQATLFGVRGIANTDGVVSSENFEMRNVELLGNLNRQEAITSSGGLILAKVEAAKGTFYNVVSKCWYINSFAETNIEDHELTLDTCVFEDSYNSLLYSWGGYINIKNSRVYGAGGPAIIADHCHPTSTTKGRNGQSGGWTSDIEIDADSEVASYVTGQEAWFAEFNAQGAAGLIVGLDTGLFSNFGKTFLTTKAVDGGSQTLLNIVVLMKSGDAEGMTSDLILGKTTIVDHVLDFAEENTAKMVSAHGKQGRNMFQSKTPSSISAVVDINNGLLQKVDGSYYMSNDEFLANPMFLPVQYGGDSGYLNIFVGGAGEGFMGVILGDFRAAA